MSKKPILAKQNKFDLWVLDSDGEIKLSSRNLTCQAASLAMIEQEILARVRPMIAPVEIRESIQFSLAD